MCECTILNNYYNSIYNNNINNYKLLKVCQKINK